MLRRIVAIVAVAVASASCTSAGDDTTTTVPSTLTTTSSTTAPTTTAPTTTAPTTTAPTTTTSTTAPTTTTTSTTAPDTTTSVPEGAITVNDGGVSIGGTPVPFGTGDEATILAISGTLGDPDADSGWIDAFSVYGTCPPPVVRAVEWDAFTVLFTQFATPFGAEGVGHFFAYTLTGPSPDLPTDDGLRIGDTLATVESLYGGPDLEVAEDPFDPSGGIWIYDSGDWNGLYGYADGTDPTSVISSINGGRGCGE